MKVTSLGLSRFTGEGLYRVDLDYVDAWLRISARLTDEVVVAADYCFGCEQVANAS